MTESVSVADPEAVISDWNGVVRKVWVDEMLANEEFESVQNQDRPHYHGPYTEAEQRQLEVHGKSALKVDDAEHGTVLRVIYVRDELIESVEEQIQVFVAVFDDGRKKDRLHLVRGISIEDVLEREADSDRITTPITDARESEGVDLTHIGSFTEYRETADQYEFEFTGGSFVPQELIEAVSPHELSAIKERASA